MKRTFQPKQVIPAETLSMMWLNIHASERFGTRVNEAHYFRILAISLDDDLSSLLLLKKLKLADEYLRLPADIVALNSFVEFRIEGEPGQFGQLVHPSPFQPNFGIDASSRLGIGLLGLRAGQSILWPDEHEKLRGLEILQVGNHEDLSVWPGTRRLPS
jgi:regulator of nucleoside diphosphate kinase